MKKIQKKDIPFVIVSYCMVVVSLTVFTSGVTDPVNLTKLFVLSGFVIAALASLDKAKFTFIAKSHGVSLISLTFFVCVSIFVLQHSPAPFQQSFYGAYGRNNGFLLYFLLSVLFFTILSTTTNNSFQKIINAMWITGIVNIFYGMWVIFFGDFVGWNNPYGSLLGTLGNPNFAGSLLGMFSVVVFIRLLKPNGKKQDRVIALVILIFLFTVIRETNAVQGRVLIATSLAVVLFYLVRGFKNSFKALFFYFLTVIPIAILSILGTLQIGPFARFIYKTSVSLRGEYWHAAIETGLRYPWSGVGFDSFGDWYRTTRRESSLILPGPDTVTNAAHNVFLDLFSFGGFPLLTSYIALNIIVLIAIIRQTRKIKTFDPIFVALVGIWLGYQLQSIISINQVGLAIWGWGLSGCLIAYEKNFSRESEGLLNNHASHKGRKIVNDVAPKIMLRTFLGSLAGLMIAFPPLNADIKWSKAHRTMVVSDFENSLTNSLLNPLNSIKIDSAVAELDSSGLNDVAHKYALIAVKFNPRSYYAWENLLKIKNSTQQEREKAKRQLMRLDPYYMWIQSGLSQ